MVQFHIASEECPVCGGEAVARVKRTSGFRSASFQCRDCGASLKTAFTPQVLWAVPVLVAAGGAAYRTIVRLHRAQHVSGAILAALIGGLFACVYALSVKVALRGIVYRRWRE